MNPLKLVVNTPDGSRLDFAAAIPIIYTGDSYGGESSLPFVSLYFNLSKVDILDHTDLHVNQHISLVPTKLVPKQYH